MLNIGIEIIVRPKPLNNGESNQDYGQQVFLVFNHNTNAIAITTPPPPLQNYIVPIIASYASNRMPKTVWFKEANCFIFEYE